MDGRRGLALAVALGAMAATGQAPFGWAWPALAALAAAIGLFSATDNWRIAAWRGWGLGVGFFALALSWIIEPFLVDIPRHGWMAPFALVFMSGGLAVFWALAFGLAARAGGTAPQRAAFLVVTLTGAEILRSHIFTGFPWALIGHAWIGWPQMHVAMLVGAHGLTFMTLLAAACPAMFGLRRVVLGVLVGAALVSAPVVFERTRVPPGAAPRTDPELVVRLVQPNAPQHLKWRPDMIPVFFERSLDLTGASAREPGRDPDLVIWPETSVPVLLRDARPAFSRMARAAGGATVVAGVQRVDDGWRWYNSLVVLDGQGRVDALYDKHHLVPFGEYMPLMDLFARWNIFGLAANATGGYMSGPGPQVLDLGPAGRALPLICYEAIFPNDIAAAPERADVLIHITNDAWFGSRAGPYQHLALARLRAVEQGLPLVRAANTGISAAFDPYGRMLSSVPLGEAGFADVILPAPLVPTPYARWGELPVTGLLIVWGLLAGLVGGQRKSD